MKPPRLPGTDKFRFCDKKFEQQKTLSLNGDEDQPDSEIVVSGNKLIRKESFLYSLPTRSVSNESLLCSCGNDHRHRNTNSLTNGSSSCTLEELISQTNLPVTRIERNKRKPHLPISSRLTSRVFTLTSYLSHLNEDESDLPIFYRDKPKGTYQQDSLTLPRNRFPEGFDCSLSRSSTPTSLDSTESASSPKLSEAKCRLHSGANFRLHDAHHVTTNLLINSTSHASLMSDESSTSLSSVQPTECHDSMRSCSCSPVEHWAKQAASQNRLSTSSQSSWEDGSGLHGVT